MRILCVLSVAFLATACAQLQYWTKPGVGQVELNTDLSACRVEGNSGGQKVFTAQELEQPCMYAKGYHLVDKP